MLFADLLSLHLVTFLMFFILVAIGVTTLNLFNTEDMDSHAQLSCSYIGYVRFEHPDQTQDANATTVPKEELLEPRGIRH